MCAIYILNRCITKPTRSQDVKLNSSSKSISKKRIRTRVELMFGKKPDINIMRVFGSDCYIHTPDVDRGSKLDPKARRGIFIGYNSPPMKITGYRVLIIDTMRIEVSRDVVFMENQFTFRGEILKRALGMIDDIDEERPYHRHYQEGDVRGAVALGHCLHVGDGRRRCPQAEAAVPGSQYCRIVVAAHHPERHEDREQCHDQCLRGQQYEEG